MLFRSRKNIYIDGFVSDSSECTDVYLFNKKILYYNEIDREKSVVFSKKELEKHLEIQSVVLKGYLDEEVIDNKVLIDEKECFAIQNMGWMRETVKDKKIFIYGFSDRSKRLARIYELLDFNIEGYIDNELYSKQEEKRVITIEELIYEEDFFVLINRECYRDNRQQLSDFGILMPENLAIDNPFGAWYLGIGNQILDINLGHSFVGKQGVCGFDVLGSGDSDSFKIVILGGSTTDGTLFPFMSWPEMLLENIKNLNEIGRAHV